MDSTNKSIGSNNTLSSKNIACHSIPVRIDFIKELLKNTKINSLINTNNLTFK